MNAVRFNIQQVFVDKFLFRQQHDSSCDNRHYHYHHHHHAADETVHCNRCSLEPSTLRLSLSLSLSLFRKRPWQPTDASFNIALVTKRSKPPANASTAPDCLYVVSMRLPGRSKPRSPRRAAATVAPPSHHRIRLGVGASARRYLSDGQAESDDRSEGTRGVPVRFSAGRQEGGLPDGRVGGRRGYRVYSGSLCRCG